MKLIAVAIAIGCLASGASAQKQVDSGLRLDANGSFRVYSLAGSVRIVGWTRDSVHVRGIIPTGDMIHIGGGPTGAKMFVENSDERNPGPAILSIYLPTHAKVWIKTATGSVTVSAVSGSLDIYTVSGFINVTGNPGELNAEAIDGDIKVVGAPGWLRAKSASGRVEFSGSSDDVTLSTVSGAVEVESGIFEKARFESVTGPIRFDGTISRGGSAVFDTHSGITNISIPKTSGTDIQIVTIAGRIVNTLTGTPISPGRYGRGGELNTTNAGGGAQLIAKSFKGDITLRSSR